jgi:hypothetical protein
MLRQAHEWTKAHRMPFEKNVMGKKWHCAAKLKGLQVRGNQLE